jgi:CheY-like chemotaxis protein
MAAGQVSLREGLERYRKVWKGMGLMEMIKRESMEKRERTEIMATILVVEDYLVARRMYSHMLRKKGHTVLAADNGLTALEQMAETPVDLVVADLSMPEMDGVALLKHLRADERYRRLPVIMLTASGQEHDRLRAEAEGANDFLTKPTSSQEFLETIQRHLALS